jgi:isopentenyl-diphosphate delta-isomerase
MAKTHINYNLLNLVNERDEIIGSVDKIQAHLGKAMLHQAISLFLFKKNQDGSFALLMQKRSNKKIVAARQWANTVCGNVAAGESHQQCLIRRLNEELGINFSKKWHDQIKKIAAFNYYVPCNAQYSEREIDHIYVLLLSDKQAKDLTISVNPLEVEETAWVNWSMLLNEQNTLGLDLAPWFPLFLKDKKIKKNINLFLKKSSINIK